MTNTVKQLSKSVREYKRDAILTPVFVIGEVAMDVVIPMLISNLIDYGITPGNMDYIYTVGFQLVVACLVALALGVLSGRHAAKVPPVLPRTCARICTTMYRTSRFPTLISFPHPVSSPV